MLQFALLTENCATILLVAIVRMPSNIELIHCRLHNYAFHVTISRQHAFIWPTAACLRHWAATDINMTLLLLGNKRATITPFNERLN